MPHIIDPDCEQVGNVFVLHGDLLKKQVALMYAQEMNEMKKITFRSSEKQREHFRESSDATQMASKLLKEANQIPQTSDIQEIQEMVNAYLAYIEIAVGFGITCLKNVSVRKNYFNKVKKYADDQIPKMMDLLNRAPPTESVLESARALVMELQAFKGITFDQVVKAGADTSSQHLAPLVKPSLSFHEETRRVQMQLVDVTGENRFALQFEELTGIEKMEVYLQYLKNAGRDAQIPATVINGLGLAGVGLLLFTAAMSCWDVYLSKTKIKTAVKEVAEFWAGYVAGNLGEALWDAAVESRITKAIVASEVVEVPALSAAFLAMGVFVAGISFGIVGAKFAGYVVDKIFESGGKHAGGAFNEANHGHRVTQPPEIVNGSAYVASMPNASALACRLAYGPVLLPASGRSCQKNWAYVGDSET